MPWMVWRVVVLDAVPGACKHWMVWIDLDQCR
jgi:hypothetical protein